MAVGWALVSTGRHADTFLAPVIGVAEDTHLGVFAITQRKGIFQQSDPLTTTKAST
jgi:hypothetical protein